MTSYAIFRTLNDSDPSLNFAKEKVFLTYSKGDKVYILQEHHEKCYCEHTSTQSTGFVLSKDLEIFIKTNSPLDIMTQLANPDAILTDIEQMSRKNKLGDFFGATGNFILSISISLLYNRS